eukprot:5710609-Pleurochrysis_carterae.AAC.1
MQTAARPRAVNFRRWIWDATLSLRNPWWCCTTIGMLSGFRYSGIAAVLTARTGYFDTMYPRVVLDPSCALAPELRSHARRRRCRHRCIPIVKVGCAGVQRAVHQLPPPKHHLCARRRSSARQDTCTRSAIRYLVNVLGRARILSTCYLAC